MPPVDIRETENELIVKADIPDVKFEDIDVRMENGTLTIARRAEIRGEEGRGRLASRGAVLRHFERVFTLPETVNPEGVKADYKNGTLTITLPKKEIAKPRQIKVQVSNN